MSKEEILDYFKDINLVYNDCTKHDTLERMLDELLETESNNSEQNNAIDGLFDLGASLA